ncbi:hypothetical protein FYJ91_18325 [Sphingomonas montanisoli]|uniref:Alginate export domain-containing protein n=1 Tax=Sphingomonas montanisoli TaxID=2606412 RepID=A0A5D9C0Q7_9SPHN|nr:hypothetical protein FYJ91_18325 [Sphingomonas montanisoli]
MGATMRARIEVIDGQIRPGFRSDDTAYNLRTTLKAEYRDGPIRLLGELWDSRIYGVDRRSAIGTSEVNTIEPVQAFVEVDLRDALGTGTTLKATAGRMMLNLGSRRLVAADDYRNTTNGYTGLRADIGMGKQWQATLVYVLPQMRRPDDIESVIDAERAIDKESFDLVLWGGVASRAKLFGGASGELSFFHLGEADKAGRPTRDRSLDTIALRLFRKPAADTTDFDVEGGYQRGSISASAAVNARRLDVLAWFVHGEAGYTLAGGWRPRLSVFIDVASGDRRGGRYGRYDTIFGFRRGEYSPAGMLAAIGRANILSPGVRIDLAPDKRSDIHASYRPMWLHSRTDAFSTTGVVDASGRAGRFAGHQFDGRGRYWIIPEHLQFEVDATYIAAGGFLRDAPNARGQGEVYLSLNLLAIL